MDHKPQRKRLNQILARPWAGGGFTTRRELHRTTCCVVRIAWIARELPSSPVHRSDGPGRAMWISRRGRWGVELVRWNSRTDFAAGCVTFIPLRLLVATTMFLQDKPKLVAC